MKVHPAEAAQRLVAEAPDDEKVEWFDEVAATYLVYQFANKREKSSQLDSTG
jgi:hypothetical protein